MKHFQKSRVVLGIFLAVAMSRADGQSTTEYEKSRTQRITPAPGSAQGSGAPSDRTARAGKTAPAWDLKGWSDGTERQLKDYRSRVVVLDFWGIWCRPCYQMIPVMKELEEEFSQQNVVFLSVHTAGSDPGNVMEVMERHEWSIPTGFDRGTRPGDGATSGIFGITGYPSMVLIGHDGKIVFNSAEDGADENRDKTMLEYKEVCHELGIGWPITIENYRTTAAMAEDLNRLAIEIYRRKIKLALHRINVSVISIKANGATELDGIPVVLEQEDDLMLSNRVIIRAMKTTPLSKVTAAVEAAKAAGATEISVTAVTRDTSRPQGHSN